MITEIIIVILIVVLAVINKPTKKKAKTKRNMTVSEIFTLDIFEKDLLREWEK